jgi:hypothetical protein
MTRLLILLTTVSLLFMSTQAVFAASVTITPAAAGSYIIQGDAMDGVAGIELTLNYDASVLASPTVTQGSLVTGALVAANTNNPGFIKIAIISTKAFSGSGQIATVTFATQNGTGGITSASVSMINSKGSPITAQVVVSSGNAASATAPGFISTPGIPFSQPTYPGTVSMPADVQNRSESKPADAAGVPVQISEPAAAKPVEPPAEAIPAAEPQKPVEVKMTSHKGVLDNFRVYKGEKSPAIFIALMNKEITSAVRQEPAVALSDGKTPLKLLVKLETVSDKSPNFSLNGAELVSLNRDASSTWIIEALPQAGITRASLTILTDSDIIEYPLTLAPPVEGVSTAEAGFAVFLKDSGAATPKRDLNGDGRHDYLDDFIYTANYLVSKAAAGKTKK